MVEDLIICRRLRVPAVLGLPKSPSGFAGDPPPPSCYKLNVDENVNAGYMHAGCVVQNSRDFFVAVFSQPLG